MNVKTIYKNKEKINDHIQYIIQAIARWSPSSVAIFDLYYKCNTYLVQFTILEVVKHILQKDTKWIESVNAISPPGLKELNCRKKHFYDGHWL